MNKLKTIKNTFGFAHHALLGVVVVALVVLAGYKVLTATHAQIPTEPDTSNPDEFYGPKGNPALDMSAGAKTPQLEVSESTSASARTPQCVYGACYYYVTSAQNDFTATGASAQLSVNKPYLAPKDSHSIMEMAVYDGLPNVDQIEVGWRVDSKHTDGKPRLFVFHWVDGQGTCYNGCGFVRNKENPIRPGSVLSAGAVRKFEINYNRISKQWRVFYNDSLLGYFPASIWSGHFTNIHSIQLYGEVAYIPRSDYNYPHSQMGNGKFGPAPGSAFIKNYTLINSNVAEKLVAYPSTDPKAYSRGNSTTTGMHLGGPGFGIFTN